MTKRLFLAPGRTTFCAIFLASALATFETFGVSNVDGQEPNGVFDVARLEREFKSPPREFTPLPFWFWNDELSRDELARQIASFEERGVYGFTIHPRIGLPADSGWMSPKLLDAMRFALEEARKRDMRVMLYDEGMYPSGSSSGQVVAEDPSYAARGFLRVELQEDGSPVDSKLKIPNDWNFAGNYQNAKGTTFAVYDAPSGGVIRGLHYLGDESNSPRESSPLAADLLNPRAVDAFIRLVYQRYYDEFEEYFRSGVVVGIFTDEPSILGRGARRGMRQGNLASLPTISKYLGYDFKPYLLDLWEDVSPESSKRRAEYDKAVRLALEEIYYGRISQWCVEHNASLAGHPEGSADVGVLRKFQIPGQDVVWRYIEPGEKAFDPTHSAMAKVASSAMIHNGARRNLNELFGAYGHEFTYDEMLWITNWCLVRGHNMLVPHAFFYSVRGPRLEERPPDVGPNSPWWDDYKTFADYCSRICWLNTDSTLVAPTAILVDSSVAPTWGTRTLFENQLDFNYLEFRSLIEDGVIDESGVAVKSARYRTLVLTPGVVPPEEARETLKKLAAQGRVLRWSDKAFDLPGAKLARDDAEAVAALRDSSGVDVDALERDESVKGLRIRHVVKGDVDFYFLFNEVETPFSAKLTFGADDGVKRVRRWNPETGDVAPIECDAANPRAFDVELAPYKTTIIAFE